MTLYTRTHVGGLQSICSEKSSEEVSANHASKLTQTYHSLGAREKQKERARERSHVRELSWNQAVMRESTSVINHTEPVAQAEHFWPTTRINYQGYCSTEPTVYVDLYPNTLYPKTLNL